MKADKGISAFPDGDNIFKWVGTIHGPEETVRFFYSVNERYVCVDFKISYLYRFLAGSHTNYP